jgi:GT2 family glycosyltransferase
MLRRPPPVTVIVAYHNTDDLKECLASLGDANVIVVDNGREDEVKLLVEGRGGMYIRPNRNIGFAPAVNLALEKRDGRDVLLLNPDARVTPLDIEAIQSVLLSDHRLAAAAPRLSGPDGSLQRVEWPVPSPREAWVEALMLRWLFAPRRVFLMGAVLMLRHEALSDVGPLDERFFLYAEEADWQLRALLRGWRVQLANCVTAQHEGARSSETRRLQEIRFYRAASLFAHKWYGRNGWVAMRIAALISALLRLVASSFKPDRRAHYARLLRMSVTRRSNSP